jgi:HAD superfamily phosphatase
MTSRMVVFDVDGVLVDVSDSYREAIQQTVEHFARVRVSRDTIQDYKNRGGWNDDWELSHRLIADAGVEVPFEKVVEQFNKLFLGNGADGLIARERWLVRPGTFEHLAARFRLAIFTGRRDYELAPTLARHAAGLHFDPIITADLVENLKPAPDGLLRIAELAPGVERWYVGDTVDDARSARAAGVPFIGIAGPSNPRPEEAHRILKVEGAIAVLDDINQLEAALPQ